MSSNSNVVIRRSDRHEIMLPVRLRVHEVDQGRVRLSPRSGHREGWVNADLVDFALGGLGLISPVFFPRGSRVQLEVLSFGGDHVAPILEIAGRIRRIIMTDRRPAYLVGLVFVEVTPEQEAQLNDLHNAISGITEDEISEEAHVRDQ